MKKVQLSSASAVSIESSWWVKGNKTLQKALSDTNPSELEIEFLSAEDAILHANEDQFYLKFGESETTDIYELESREESQIGEKEIQGHYLSTIQGRFVITNLLSGQIRSDKKTAVDNKRTVEKLDETLPLPVAKRLQVDSQSNAKAPRPALLASSNIPSSAQEKKNSGRTSSKGPKLDVESVFLLLENCSSDTTVENLQTFFSGLSFKQAFLSVYRENGSQLMFKVYVSFENLRGAHLGLVRNGEELICSDSSISLQIRSLSKIEAFWVENTAIILDSASSTQTILNTVNRFPHLELSDPLLECQYWFHKFESSFLYVSHSVSSFIELFQVPFHNDHGYSVLRLNAENNRKRSDYEPSLTPELAEIANKLRSLSRTFALVMSQGNIFFVGWIQKRMNFFATLNQLWMTHYIHKKIVTSGISDRLNSV